MSPLRCHLLIGHPASGKTTLANDLAPLLSGPGEPPAQVLSTDAIRAEVFGDRSVQGPWIEIQQRLHQRLVDAAQVLLEMFGDELFDDHNHFRAEVGRALKLQGSKLGAADLKVLYKAVSWREETAPPVITKVHKPGKQAAPWLPDTSQVRDSRDSQLRSVTVG